MDTRGYRRRVARLMLLGPVLGLIVLAGGAIGAGHRLTAPAPASVGPPPSDLAVESIVISRDSSHGVTGWYIPSTGKAAGVLLLHPLHANRLTMLSRARFLSRAGYAVLMIDFQAHGESPGDHITFGYLESEDTYAAIRFLKDRVGAAPVGIIGCSLGGASALLSKDPLDAQAVVLEGVYPTVEEAVENRIRIRLGVLAKPLAPLLLMQLRPRLGITVQDLRPIDRIGFLGAPTLIIAGTRDPDTTIEESQRLYENALPPKEFWPIEGAMHVDFHRYAGETYEKHVLDFFEKYLALNALPPPPATNEAPARK